VSTLQVSNLRKNYGRKIVLRGIDFSMKEGEVVGLLGPNGAGKTTCFYSIVGFIQPTSGEILLNDHNITSLPMYRRARLGISYLPQEASVFRKLSVENNIWAILESRGDLDMSRRKEKLEQLLEDLGLQDKRRQPAYTLSGGERRRTEIARSLAIDPHFLLLDEPFAGIDPIAVHEIKNIIGHLRERNIGILITDHNVRDTLEITNHSYILKDGEIVAQGSRDEIIANALAREVYLGESFRA
jgi:lipopolysaccharide export system ATP-binding protein